MNGIPASIKEAREPFAPCEAAARKTAIREQEDLSPEPPICCHPDCGLSSLQNFEK